MPGIVEVGFAVEKDAVGLPLTQRLDEIYPEVETFEIDEYRLGAELAVQALVDCVHMRSSLDAPVADEDACGHCSGYCTPALGEYKFDTVPGLARSGPQRPERSPGRPVGWVEGAAQGGCADLPARAARNPALREAPAATRGNDGKAVTCDVAISASRRPAPGSPPPSASPLRR